MKIVSISGLDGSGKSTQIKLLRSYLESQGKKVFYFHAIEFGLAKKISTFFREHCLICKLLKKCSVPKEEKSVTKSGKPGIILRKIFLKIDIHRFEKLYKKLEKEGFDYIISDRYFYDTIVNIEYLNYFLTSDVRKRLTSDFKIPDVVIYLSLNPEIIMQRDRKPDQGTEYLKVKKMLYDKLAPVWNLRIIDGNKNKEEIFEAIKKLV